MVEMVGVEVPAREFEGVKRSVRGEMKKKKKKEMRREERVKEIRENCEICGGNGWGSWEAHVNLKIWSFFFFFCANWDITHRGSSAGITFSKFIFVLPLT